MLIGLSWYLFNKVHNLAVKVFEGTLWLPILPIAPEGSRAKHDFVELWTSHTTCVYKRRWFESVVSGKRRRRAVTIRAKTVINNADRLLQRSRKGLFDSSAVLRRFTTSFITITRTKMSLRYHNKVVIVTGGSKGIGRGIVRVFGKVIIVINYLLYVHDLIVKRRTEHFASFF